MSNVTTIQVEKETRRYIRSLQDYFERKRDERMRQDELIVMALRKLVASDLEMGDWMEVRFDKFFKGTNLQ